MTFEVFDGKRERDTISHLGEFKLHATAKKLKPKRTYLTGEKKAQAKETIYDYLSTMNGKKVSYTTVFVKTDMPSENVTARLIGELIKEGRVTKQFAGSGLRFYCHGKVETMVQRMVQRKTEFTPEQNTLRELGGLSQKVADANFVGSLDEWFMKYSEGPGTWPENDLNHINKFRVWVKQQIKENG